MSLPNPALSVVIPFYNEEDNVSDLLSELKTVLATLAVPAEVIAINDGSRDGTLSVLVRVAQKWPELTVVDLKKNVGQAGALWAGFGVTQGEWIATLDGDGQNPPSEIIKLWNLRSQSRMIVGRRVIRRDSRTRQIMSKVANVVRQALLRDGVRDSGCALKLFHREVVKSFIPLRTLYSFMPACARMAGWNSIEVPVNHRNRMKGESKYGLRVMALVPLFDLMLLFWLSKRVTPIRDLDQRDR